MQEICAISTEVGVKPACEAFDIPRASFYRALSWQDEPRISHKRPSPPRALSAEEREKVIEVLHSDRFADKAPQEVYATLLDEGTYYCSIRTMYRILEDHGEIKERRNQLMHPAYQKPELLATGPPSRGCRHSCAACCVSWLCPGRPEGKPPAWISWKIHGPHEW